MVFYVLTPTTKVNWSKDECLTANRRPLIVLPLDFFPFLFFLTVTRKESLCREGVRGRLRSHWFLATVSENEVNTESNTKTRDRECMQHSVA